MLTTTNLPLASTHTDTTPTPTPTPKPTPMPIIKIKRRIRLPTTVSRLLARLPLDVQAQLIAEAHQRAASANPSSQSWRDAQYDRLAALNAADVRAILGTPQTDSPLSHTSPQSGGLAPWWQWALVLATLLLWLLILQHRPSGSFPEASNSQGWKYAESHPPGAIKFVRGT